ncbi:methyltransferase domain-containing protein [Agromyces seonyuensis]|uniref:Methyltransferase domain-containing protein n=1 Tax=Agromyces seonyuensis TaxID=2662446 RepID=A0A6I4P885_9MICO|nr:methyltransferase domain-containing protein [Agromyces seonyuensis]MWC00215.1 methyltransferase domain-containing protein [Agromyces seonyuensis]
MNLSRRDDALRELMDDPACDPRLLRATLRRFGTVNRLVSGWGAVYRRHVRPVLAGLGRPARVLDLGSGGGDVLVRLATLARRDGLEASWLGIDPDPRALAVASERDAPANVAFRSADAATLRAEGEVFDLVLSSHVLHHLDAGLPGFLDDSLALAQGPVLHSDIERGRLAYALYTVGITPFAPGTFLRCDGLRSIRRSFTAPELAAAAGPTGRWHVERPVPFRLLAVGDGRA